MEANEYKAWADYMKSCRGLWTIDPIHNGDARDLIAFRPDLADETKGVYISVDGNEITAGRYDNAYPTLTDGEFRVAYGVTLIGQGPVPGHRGCRKPTQEAFRYVLERMGVEFLTQAICRT